jgi:putative drug exporter of the RND superfamily
VNSIGQFRRPPLARLASWCFTHRRIVLAGWLLAVAALIGVAVGAGSSFSDNYASPGLPAQQAQNLLAAKFPAQAGATVDVVLRSGQPLSSASVDGLVAALRRQPQVSSVTSPLTARGQLSADGKTGFAVVTFDTTDALLPGSAASGVIATALRFAGPGLKVAVGGTPADNVVSAAPGSSEGIGITAAVIIMLVAFGSVVAMGLPLLIALVGVGTGFGIVFAASHLLTVPSFGPDLMAMIGLGVGIDYALFIVTRYRQELQDGHDPLAATSIAISTAGRSVLFAGGTVVIALLGLLVVDMPFMDGLATGTVLAVLMVLGAAVTLLPALLGFAGPAIDRLRVPGLANRRSSSGFWYRWSLGVQRRPWACALGALLVLGTLAVPLLSMRLAFSDAGNEPVTLTTRQAYDMLSEGFGPGFNGPLVIAASRPGPSSGEAAAGGALDSLAARIRVTADVASVSPPVLDRAGDAGVIVVYPRTGPQAAATADLVAALRSRVIPVALSGTGVTAYVGGETAAGIDTASYLGSRLPWVVGTVILLGFILLMVAFRSVLVPVKAALMNVLSIGAAYGVIVAVYQWGWLSAVFGVSRPGPIDPWIPLMMFAIVFGLSMDYEVFLVSRIRERWLAAGDNSVAVAEGVAVTARVITAAAAIMVCVFASFVINDPLHVLNVFGLGLAVAVFIDATVVRLVLVPAVMQLLGAANWWLPGFLPTGKRAGENSPDRDTA